MADIKDPLVYNYYHPWWDPIGPPYETNLDEAGQTQLAQIRLAHAKEVLAAHSKAIDAATALLANSKAKAAQ
jgi:hypothetical protein